MNIELKDLSETRKALTVTLDKSEVDSEYQSVLGEFSKHARLPGFRPGKAPATLVVKHYGKDLKEEFKNKVMAKAYRSGLDQSKLDILNLVDVEQSEIEPGLSAAITFQVDIRPSFILPDYVGLTTQVVPTEPTDAEIDSMIQGLRQERAEFNVTERPSQKGDYLKLGYVGTIDGKSAKDLVADKPIYAEMPQTWEEAGSIEGLIPGLGAQLEGLKAGDKKDVTITFANDFAAAPALAGKTVVYAVTIQEVREKVLPELSEEFFKSHQVENLDGLKTQMRQNLTMRKEYENRQAQRRQVSDALASKVDFSIPESLIESETQNVLRQFIEENMRRGVPQEQFEKDKKELYENARKAAVGRVKVQMILAKIAEAEKLTLEDRDYDNYITREAMRGNTKPDKIAKELGKNREQLRAVQQGLLFDKALDFLVSKATVSTVAAQA